MKVRYLWLAALLAIVCLVLYLPSASPPERFIEILRAEDATSRALWGQRVADRILGRLLDVQRLTPAFGQAPAEVNDAPVAPPLTRSMVPNAQAVTSAIAAQLDQMSMRLLGITYLRSIDALLALATYRLCAIFEFAPLLASFLAVVAIDGLVIRKVRACELIGHSAEVFSVHLIVGSLVLCGVAVAFFVPLQLHPMPVALSLLAALFVLSRAASEYHMLR